MRERRKAHPATRRRAGFGPKPSKSRKPKAGGLAGFKELWTGPAPRKGYLLERLVAALHGAAGDDVTVTWNDHISGRQFDSTLRFKKAYYNYLTAIECRDFESRISVDRVEAFVTKCRDARIDKGVMASTIGFQSGAETVAAKHNISLLTVEERHISMADENRPPVPGITFAELRFHRLEGLPDIIPNETTGEMEYVVSQAKVVHDGKTFSIPECITARYPGAFTTMPTKEEVLAVQFPSGGLLEIWSELTEKITGFQITRTPADFYHPKP